MSLEAAAVILALLWGPTALWLIFRAVRGPATGTRESFAREPAQIRTEQRPLDAVIRNEYWICKDCRSVNHLGATQCYSCGIKRPPPPEPVAPAPTPASTGWVAVMDPAVGRRPSEPVALVQVQETSRDLPPDPPPAAPMPEHVPEPPMVAAGAAATSRAMKRPRSPRRPRTQAGGATAAELSVAAHMTAAPPAAVAPVVAPLPPEPTPQLPQVAPSIAPPVCPYLGFKDDPATQCSYPDSRNFCHAAAAKAGTPNRLVRGVRGRARTLPISDEHQATLCLTNQHRACDRYPADQLPAALNTTH